MTRTIYVRKIYIYTIFSPIFLVGFHPFVRHIRPSRWNKKQKQEQPSVIISHHDGTKLLCRGWNLWTHTGGWSCIILTQPRCLNLQKTKRVVDQGCDPRMSNSLTIVFSFTLTRLINNSIILSKSDIIYTVFMLLKIIN